MTGVPSMAMGSTPILGITTYAPREGLARFHLPVEYVEAVRRAGAMVWLIPPGEPHLPELVARLDGLVLSGGGDLDPAHYGGATDHPELYGVHRERDATELALARAAFDRKLPTLGICRGCQVVNVAFGGSLIEHLPDEVGHELAHRGEGPGTSKLHEVDIARGSRLLSIVGRERPSTASSHHQALRRVAGGFTVSAHAPDGTIEAVERRDHPFYLAVQWHPEETAAEDPGQQRLFDALAAAALVHRKERI
jgi:putative glutamine amidotransferase